jgi:hypothetical protein
MRSYAALPAVLLLAACATLGTSGAPEPRDGRELLARMHDRYAGKWFNALTFVQKTTVRRPDGTTSTSTWYEAQLGSRLRIDVGDPSAGNGMLYTADSAYRVRAGKVVRVDAEGNPFLPLIASVYLEPMDVTLKQLAPYNVDMSRIRSQDWEGRPTYVVGSASPSDTTSPQFWVDRERLVVTRFIMPLFPTPDKRSQDVRLENYVRVGGGWLSPRVRFLDKGVEMQTEEYSDWRTDIVLPASFFQVEHWSEGRHWAKP